MSGLIALDRKRQTSRERRAERSKFSTIRKAEAEYARQLRKIARHVGEIISGFPIGDPGLLARLQQVLQRYSEVIHPWAEVQAERMLAEVSRRDEIAWAAHGREIGRALRKEVRDAPTGLMLRQFLDEQVALITSLPIEAAERVHKLTLEGLFDGTRAAEIAKEIGRSGEVTTSRANLIARTEVARTASGLTMARAQFVGSTHYTWRTARDRDVRKSHREMEGKTVAWSAPPHLSDGTVTHAGQIYNCRPRCYPEPLVPTTF